MSRLMYMIQKRKDRGTFSLLILFLERFRTNEWIVNDAFGVTGAYKQSAKVWRLRTAADFSPVFRMAST